MADFQTVEIRTAKYKISGTIKHGFKDVLFEFENNFEKDLENNAQVCISYKGIEVVNLVGSKNIDSNYNNKTVQNIFSSGKTVVSIAIAMLVDRKLISYNQKITDIWPEYGSFGKNNTTLRHVLNHEAGLPKLDRKIPLEHLETENMKNFGVLGNIIALSKPCHVPGEKRIYHAQTRGWILSEILRRVDPNQRTLGEFIHDEISIPLNIQDELILGIKSRKNISPVKLITPSWVFKNIVKKNSTGMTKIERLGLGATFLAKTCIENTLVKFNILKKGKIFNNMSKFQLPDTIINKKGIIDDFAPINDINVRKLEIGSANIHASAQALCKLATIMANEGSIDNFELITKEGIFEGHCNPDEKPIFSKFKSSFVNMGVNYFAKPMCTHDRDGFYGWMGLGGSVLQWHKELNIGFAYVMDLCFVSPLNPRAHRIQKAVIKCISNL